LLTAAAALVAVAALAPLLQLTVRAVGGDFAASLANLWRPRTGELLINTISLTATVSVACLLLGLAIAWAVTRVALPGRALWWTAVCLPLAVPSFVAAFAFKATWPTVHGFWPLVLVLTLSLTPYVTAPVMGALALADHSQVEVARTLGVPPATAVFRVLGPQVLPAALAGALLVALYTLADFGAPAMLRFETMTTGIYAQFTGGLDRSLSATSALVLAALALLCISGERRARSRTARGERSVSTARPPLIRATRTRIIAAALVGISVLAAVAFPVGALIVRSFSAERFGSTPVDLLGAGLTSLAIGLATATIATLAALPVAYLAARFRGRLTSAIEAAAFVGHALPGLVVAIALVALSLQFTPGAYQTLTILIVAYVILFVPKAIGSARTAISQVPLPIEDVAQSLGRSSLKTWWSVTFPLSLPGTAVGFLLVALSVMKELPATLMLRPIGVDTLATELWSKTSIGAYGAAAPVGILLIIVGVVPAWLVARSVRRAM